MCSNLVNKYDHDYICWWTHLSSGAGLRIRSNSSFTPAPLSASEFMYIIKYFKITILLSH